MAAFVTAIGAIAWMRTHVDGAGVFGITGPTVFYVGIAGLLACAFFWWRDVIREANRGDHTPVVQLHLRYGMILFIASEVMFFVAWFWGYFDSALFPAGVHELANNAGQLVGLTTRNEVYGGAVAAGAGGSHQRGYSRLLQAHLRSVGSAARQHARSC